MKPQILPQWNLKKIFEEIISNVKVPNSQNWKLIIIFDNLDRICPEDTKSILSTLQTFFQYQQRNDNKKNFRNIWTIIPYDPEGMRKIWEEGENSNGGNYARRMLEKRFQVRYYTPPIIFTGWKRYMLMKLDLAFREPTRFDAQREKTFESIYIIYSQFINWWSTKTENIESGALNGDEVLPISPRDLIIFINQLGTLYQQRVTWDAEVKIEAWQFMSY